MPTGARTNILCLMAKPKSDEGTKLLDADAPAMPFLTDADLAYEPLSLPEFADERFAFYAVRLEGDEGYWPALPVDGLKVHLCHPDVDKKRIYPPFDPGHRRPRAQFENPDHNLVVMAHTPEGGKPMYMADVLLYGLPNTGAVNVARRGWRRVDNPDVVYFEDLRAAANTPWKHVVEIVGWCPLKAIDDHGYPGDHGVVHGAGEAISRNREGTGWCLTCKKGGIDRQKRALKRITQIRDTGRL